MQQEPKPSCLKYALAPGRPFRKGEGGRKRGSKNRVPAGLVKDTYQAYRALGGVDYLVKIGQKDRALFVHLLSKLLPRVEVIRQEAPAPAETLADVRAMLEATCPRPPGGSAGPPLLCPKIGEK